MTFFIRLVRALPLAVLVCAFAQKVEKPGQPKWQPARYRNLTVGTSTMREVVASLGHPKYVGREEDSEVPMWTYEVQAPLPGYLYVYPHHGKLGGLVLGLKSRITMDEMIRLYGRNYSIVHYDFDDCLVSPESGSAPVFQSPTGTVIHMEFAELGISANMSGGMISEIAYTSHPAGPSHSRCVTQVDKRSRHK